MSVFCKVFGTGICSRVILPYFWPYISFQILQKLIDSFNLKEYFNYCEEKEICQYIYMYFSIIKTQNLVFSFFLILLFAFVIFIPFFIKKLFYDYAHVILPRSDWNCLIYLDVFNVLYTCNTNLLIPSLDSIAYTSLHTPVLFSKACSTVRV